uniref:Uncharacterized protein n=1 Tax=Arundo donax TaxID=35708 RepID=A0A0A8Z986_ARUDO
MVELVEEEAMLPPGLQNREKGRTYKMVRMRYITAPVTSEASARSAARAELYELWA